MMVSDIDWADWQACDDATLVFVVCDGQMLLIHKKRGLGAGKINGPGGRMEPGESAMACAVREVQEELKITPQGIRHAGVLRFQFVDGYSIRAQVFTATGYTGTPTETDEARPEWFPADDPPYDRMWADDRVWIPLMLAGEGFDGRFVFDGDTMVDAVVSCDAKPENSPGPV